MDNIFTEGLWRSLKQKEVYLYDHQTPGQSLEGIARYLTSTTTGVRTNPWEM